jgi:CRP-like cAMP-binding protein
MPRTKADDVIGSVPLFAGLSKRDARRIGDLMTEQSVPAGTVVAREGERGDEFYVILEGEATVTREGKAVNRLGPGRWFGEVALLGDSTRAATVVAASDMRVSVLQRRHFTELLTTAPEVTRKMLKGLARILHDQARQ